MLFVKYFFMAGGVGMMGLAAAILAYDLYRKLPHGHRVTAGGALPNPPTRWPAGLALAMLGWGPILIVVGILVMANGEVGLGQGLYAGAGCTAQR